MTIYLDDGDVRIYHGDALEQLAAMPAESVQCIVTSPPFWALRSYIADDHVDKPKEHGLESTPDEWCTRLVAVFRECRRVLRNDAVMFVEVGDTYHDKQLVGAPWRLAFALQKDGWFLRSDVIWARLPPNPMPESVTDRPTKAHSYVFLLTKSARYFYDADSIREAHTGPPPEHYGVRTTPKERLGADAFVRVGEVAVNAPREYNPAGRNARSVWSIATEPTPFAHFATFAQALVERCILAGTSEHGCCSACGAPWTRQVERDLVSTRGKVGDHSGAGRADVMDAGSSFTWSGGVYGRHEVTTTGWEPSCRCVDAGASEDFGEFMPPPVRPCVVLDPFMGSGTTALVARRLGRHAVGVELNADYLAIAARRLQQLSLLGGAS